MSFLLDTNVISELRKPVGRAAPAVQAWGRRQLTSELFLSVVTVRELDIGVTRIERRDRAQGEVLRRWLERDLLVAFADRILPIDLAAVRRAAVLHVPDPRPERDALIAATALAHGLVVVTRNTVDFRALGVELVDPWDT